MPEKIGPQTTCGALDAHSLPKTANCGLFWTNCGLFWVNCGLGGSDGASGDLFFRYRRCRIVAGTYALTYLLERNRAKSYPLPYPAARARFLFFPAPILGPIFSLFSAGGAKPIFCVLVSYFGVSARL